ncbi:MAG: DEAD/DEAH box helicase, partial [Desulfotomaculaceae bacterium]|nr:DEAD/DEAH box helicase [Desulfotomaculaceae bacterium]
LLNSVRELLADGQPRSKADIIAITGLENLDSLVWRHFPQLPDGRFTLPDSDGAWEFLLKYLREKPRRLSDLLRLFRRHKKILDKIAAENDQAPLLRLPQSLITTADSPEGRDELARRAKIKACREILETLTTPFFDPREAGLGTKEFASIADSYSLTASFENHKYWCLRREFPGDVLVEQLGEISGRYFAPPYTASAPSFLREHSLGEKEAAAVLGVDEDTLAFLINAGHLGSFTLDERTRLWHSDIQELQRNGVRLRELTKQHEKLKIPQAAALLGISTSQVRRLIQEGRLATVSKKEVSGPDTGLLLRRDLEALRQALPALTLSWGQPHKREQGDTGALSEERLRAKKKPPRRAQEQALVEDLVLDDFQIEAAEALQAGLSVIVSAPTGNGKTLVAEMLARDVMLSGLGMIYTSPLKALSNQKYRDFKKLFGDEQVGLVTGDVSINPGAPMLIMTTEIFRNWCLSEPDQLEKISYVVFDEIHYLDDAERGTTWEESILFAPNHVKILGLSATVPNADEMADWISSVRGGNVVVIMEKRRRVPLSTQWILPNGQIVGEKEARSELEELVEYLKALRNKKRWIEE